MERTREKLVKSAALEAGFSLVGISGVSPDDRTNRVYERWLDAGMHGEMDYLFRHRDRRRDPSRLLDGARSAICVALNYYQAPEQTQPAAEGRGLFSIYAYGRDYHVVMGEMLERLDSRIKQLFPGTRSLACVDTKPVSDRSMALRAGIGWLGKNSNVISPQYGSWIFLGELLTDLDLKPDVPLETLCGDCTRCIDACPTGALETPFVVDARRCISYLTIEKRGEIPAGLHEKIGAYVFGFDRCQSVCPFNQVAVDSLVFGHGDRNPLIDMPLDKLQTIADAEFYALTRDSAIRRCKPEGMRRNAAIARRNLESASRRYSRREDKPKT